MRPFVDTCETAALAYLIESFDAKMLTVLEASAAAPYWDERTLKRRSFYTCGYSGDRIPEPDHRPLQKAVWWLRNRERLSKGQAWLVARHGGFSAFSRLYWMNGPRNTPWRTFKRAWRAAGTDPKTWASKKPRSARRPASEPLWSAKSDWLKVWQYVAAHPGISHRDLRRADVLEGRYRHLRIQAALGYLEAVELLEVERAGRGQRNLYFVHGRPVIKPSEASVYGCAFTNVPRKDRDNSKPRFWPVSMSSEALPDDLGTSRGVAGRT
jgi:hypothetical protein